MGQKTPPKANRLGITEAADSTTFAEFREGQFAATLQEDHAIRTYLDKKLKNVGLSKTLIQRKPGQLQINLVTARPGLIFGKGGEGLEQIKKESKDFEKFNRNIHIELNELDALALQKSEDSADTLNIVANQDLKRGEYRLSGHQSMLLKRFED